eukprot:gene13902-15351_t
MAFGRNTAGLVVVVVLLAGVFTTMSTVAARRERKPANRLTLCGTSFLDLLKITDLSFEAVLDPVSSSRVWTKHVLCVLPPLPVKGLCFDAYNLTPLERKKVPLFSWLPPQWKAVICISDRHKGHYVSLNTIYGKPAAPQSIHRNSAVAFLKYRKPRFENRLDDDVKTRRGMFHDNATEECCYEGCTVEEVREYPCGPT